MGSIFFSFPVGRKWATVSSIIRHLTGKKLKFHTPTLRPTDLRPLFGWYCVWIWDKSFLIIWLTFYVAKKVTMFPDINPFAEYIVVIIMQLLQSIWKSWDWHFPCISMLIHPSGAPRGLNKHPELKCEPGLGGCVSCTICHAPRKTASCQRTP